MAMADLLSADGRSFGEMAKGEPIQLSMGNRRQSIMMMDDNSDVFMSQRSGFEGDDLTYLQQKTSAHAWLGTSLAVCLLSCPLCLSASLPEHGFAGKLQECLSISVDCFEVASDVPASMGSTLRNNQICGFGVPSV